MNANIERLKLIFIAIFLVLVAGAGVWQVGWVMPQKACEKAHRWWDHGQRVCAQPVLISDITGRTLADKKAEAETRAALGRATTPAK